MVDRDIVRRVRFAPYRSGMGPRFSLVTWDTHRSDGYGRTVLGYRLTMREPGRRSRVLFEEEDFVCSPMHAIDSDRAINALMGFLTVRPGDTDAAYFERYTEDQLAYTSHYAEALGAEVFARFGED